MDVFGLKFQQLYVVLHVMFRSGLTKHVKLRQKYTMSYIAALHTYTILYLLDVCTDINHTSEVMRGNQGLSLQGFLSAYGACGQFVQGGASEYVCWFQNPFI